MKKLIIIISVAVLILGIWAWSLQNSLVDLKQEVDASYDVNMLVYSKVQLTIEETGLAADKYGQAVKEAIVKANESRYGGGGAKGAMLWLKEQNPNLNPAVYEKLQRVIVIKFDEFGAEQKTLRDKCRLYIAKVEKQPNHMMAWLLGYSKDDIAEQMRTLVTDSAKQDFKDRRMTSPHTGTFETGAF